jgi:hypothetical protein
MSHKFAVGQDVYYEPPVKHGAAKGIYKITARVPIESDGRVLYRERTADEKELSAG